MREFDHPSAHLEGRGPLDQLLLLSPGPDVRYEAVGLHHLFFSHVRRVQAKILRHVLVCRFDDSPFQQRLERNASMPVRSGDDQ